jgi:glutathione S-transferase
MLMLELYLHPLASYCWKVLLAFYESDTPFTPRVIDLGDPVQRAELTALWPIARFPVLRDHARGEVVPESSIIVEYLARHHPRAAHLVPDDLDVRIRDRFFDLHVMEPMSRIVRDLIVPGDPARVAADQQLLRTAYAIVETWPERSDFTLADCAAAPSLFYADQLVPIDQPRTRAYLGRLLARPSMIRVRREAAPYWHLFPGARATPSRLVAGDALV